MLRGISGLCLAFTLTVGVLPTAAEAPPPTVQKAADYVRPPAPGQLVDVGGRRLHLLCKGSSAGPAVIFEAGLSGFTANSTYGKAQDAIAPFARVCTYDRAGLGWSDPAPAGRNIVDMADDLHRLLRAAKIRSPYVLVGHSFGGLIVRLYAVRYRREVAGLVLADATPEDFSPEAAAARSRTVATIDAALKGARPGVPVVTLPAGTPPEVGIAALPEVLVTEKEEFLSYERMPPRLRLPGGFGKLGSTPLAVIRRGLTAQPPSATDLDWRQAQEHLASLSTNSILIVAEKSRHVIPYDQPLVVADAVQRVLNAARTGKALAGQ